VSVVGNEWAPAITFSVFALTAGTALVLRGPMGKALAEWIRGWSHTEAKWIEAKGAPTEVAALRADVEELRHELADVHERLDFAERLLAKTREADRLAPPR
jgi:hypothetical protein